MEKDRTPSLPAADDQSEAVVSLSDDPSNTLSGIRLAMLMVCGWLFYLAGSFGIFATMFALAFIQTDLGVSRGEVQWVVAATMIPWGCLQLISGRVSDIIGRRKMAVAGTTGMVLFNVLTAFMPNLASICVMRGLVGVCHAVAYPPMLGLLGAYIPPGIPRLMGFGGLTVAGGVGCGMGQIITGLFVQYTEMSWRASFIVCGGTSVFPLGTLLLIAPKDASLQAWSLLTQIDWLGATLVGSSLFCLMFAFTLVQTEDQGWSLPYLPAIFVLGVIFCALFVHRQYRFSHPDSTDILDRILRRPRRKILPILPASLFSRASRNVAAICIAGFFAFAAEYTPVLVTYYYRDELALSPLESGLRQSMFALGALVVSIVGAVGMRYIPVRAIPLACLFVAFPAPILWIYRQPQWSYWQADPWAMILLVVGVDSLLVAGLTLIADSTRSQDQSTAVALFQSCVRFGITFGVGIGTLVRDSVERRSGILMGLRAGHWTVFGCLVISFLTVLLGMEGWRKVKR